MYEFISNHEQSEILERNFAYGFWFFANFVKDWSSHKDFRKDNNYSEEYYTQVYEIIYFLAEWYFSWECPFIEKESFLEEFDEINNLFKM